MPATATQEPEKETVKPLPASSGGTVRRPPPAGSDEEMAETALAAGFGGAFGTSCKSVEAVIRHRLLWES